ncbi:hypothetical protein [Methylotuvimicrobium buryatense]|uniref:Uncharacterized protein n=1 Tax=Methylotuvimicrobium buryatense TaxID=95641 RepID=A0A4P9UL04_METBY|nr:hypothetical protein [Methylotuvimicrobium buryatense]QCW81023.1 hypothetical protein EQU24_01205 [Methylotuvimicrobium buryatense]
MKKYITPLISLTLGIFLIIIGINMSKAQNMWDEKKTDQIIKPGTKVRNAAIGAGVGAVGGGVTATIVGGIGIVVAGTGVGLPAGIGLISLAAGLGAGAGAVAGAATGDTTSVDTVTTTITHVAPVYETWQWGVVLAIGFFLLIYSVYKISRFKVSP